MTAKKHWAVAEDKEVTFSSEVVETIYKEELCAGGGEKPAPINRIAVLEISQYLERYLLPNFSAEESSFAHTLSIIHMVNEKFREGVPPWACFHQNQDTFESFFQKVVSLKKDHEFLPFEKITYLHFFIHCFQSLEDEMVRKQVLPLVSLPLWRNLSLGHLQVELKANPQLEKHWRYLERKEKKAAKQAGYTPPAERAETWFIPALLAEFQQVLENAVLEVQEEEGEEAEVQGPAVHDASLLYCERFLEFVIDLLSQLPTRRFVRTLLDDNALVVKCRLSNLYQLSEGRLFGQLTDLFRYYQGFEINDHSGSSLTDEEMQASQSERLQQLQRLAFKHVPKLIDLALQTCGVLEKRGNLTKYLEVLDPEELKLLATRQLRLLSAEDPWADRVDFLTEVVVSSYEKRRSQRQKVNELPLYPTEDVLFDENLAMRGVQMAAGSSLEHM
eukprot:gene19254-23016_t